MLISRFTNPGKNEAPPLLLRLRQRLAQILKPRRISRGEPLGLRPPQYRLSIEHRVVNALVKPLVSATARGDETGHVKCGAVAGSVVTAARDHQRRLVVLDDGA